MIKVFIVDDHEIIVRGLKMILKNSTDLTVVGDAHDGSEAIEKVVETDIDVLLLDMNMPGISGIELLVELKRLKPQMHILVLTIHPEDRFALKTLKAGASGYLCKDTALEELVIAIHKVHEKGRYISETLAEQLAFDLVPDNDNENSRNVLNEKEQYILIKIASGEKVKDIANEMRLSISTIFTYRMKIFEKLKLNNNVELTHYAIENKLVG